MDSNESNIFSINYVSENFLKMLLVIPRVCYSEVPNRRADRNKRAGFEKIATLLAYLLSKLMNEQGGIFHFTK